MASFGSSPNPVPERIFPCICPWGAMARHRMIEIILAEDHQVVREALRLLLETQADIHVAAETGEGWAALQLVKENRPDVLILDWMLPGLSGPEVARRVKTLSPATKIIMLSMYDTE